MLCHSKFSLCTVNASPHLSSPYTSIFQSHRRISRSLSASKGSVVCAMSTCSTSDPVPESKQGPKTQNAIEQVLTYHKRSKHFFTKYARGPHGLDWANQPSPFLRFISSPLVPLEHFPLETANLPPNRDPHYSSLFQSFPPPSSISNSTISQFFYDSLALSAWKTTGTSTWSLRVNPSSGNLHPTEAYLIAPPIESISITPFVAHYAPKEHSLEIRAQIPDWFFPKFFPANSFLIGISSILWREAWKYGERGFRYCNHDVGHAIGALAIAAATLGWDVKVLDALGYDDVLKLMGLHCYPQFRPPLRHKRGRFPDIEFEHPDCIVAVFPTGMSFDVNYADLSSAIAEFSNLEWKGKPSSLSEEHVCWNIIYGTAEASMKPLTAYNRNSVDPFQGSLLLSETSYKGFTAREIVRKRRSALDMDGVHVMKRETFYQILLHCLPSGHHLKQGKQLALPFRVLTWDSQVHAALFVHRVSDLPMGLYLLVRNEDHLGELKASTRNDFKWLKPEGCPHELPLYQLTRGDCQRVAKQVSCHQDIASDGCFSLGMIARFEPSLCDKGAWMYPRLFWETGVLGQVLYLEAHAVGISATGIGCYFDDTVHELLGLQGEKFQSFYHFTVGAPLLDKRIMSLPAYPGPDVDA